MFFQSTCIQSNKLVKGGASGGPVFDRDGVVIGINTSGYNLIPNEEPISFSTPIQVSYQIEVPKTIKGKTQKKNLIELAKMGGVFIK